MWYDVTCDVIWFSPKALPSLYYFVIIVSEFIPKCPNDPKRGKQAPKTKKGEKLQEKLLEKLRTIIEFVLWIILSPIYFPVEFKDNFWIIENAKVRPKVRNPNLINFTSLNRFEPLTFVNNSPDLGNDIDHSEESDMFVDF